MKRFWSKVAKSDGCWEWTAAIGDKGYGRFAFRGRNASAHRVSWILSFGEIPAGLCVLHKCDNPPCVNPDHLFLGTPKDNVDDMVNKGRCSAKFGDTNPNVKLPKDLVVQIRARFASGESTRRQLAEELGMHRSYICQIINKRVWSQL